MKAQPPSGPLLIESKPGEVPKAPENPEVDKVLADSDAALKLDPKLAPAYLQRGLALGMKWEHDRALADFEQCITLDPDNAEAFYERGLAWYGKATAISLFGPKPGSEDREAETDEAKRPEDFVQWRKFLDKAAADLTRTLELDPKLSKVYEYRAAIWHMLGKYDKSLADYGEILKLDPKDMVARTNRAAIYLANHEPEKADAEYDELVKQNPKDAFTRRTRASFSIQRKAYDKAIADYDEAIRLDPNNPDTYTERGFVWALKGDQARSTADFRQAEILQNKK